MYDETARQFETTEQRYLEKRLFDLQNEKDEKNDLFKWLGVFLLGALVYLVVEPLFREDIQLAFLERALLYFGIAIVLGLIVLVEKWYSNMKVNRELSRVNKLLSTGHVFEKRIQSTRLVKIKEVRNEGPCYIFDVGDGKVFHLMGENAKNPNSDFSIVEIRDQDDRCYDSLLTRRGKKLVPIRTLKLDKKAKFRLPTKDRLIEAPFEDIDELWKARK